MAVAADIAIDVTLGVSAVSTQFQIGMIMNLRFFFLYLFIFSGVANAQTQARIASESRDAATGYVLTQNFIIGRTAKDCFDVLGRTDTPKSFVTVWQSRNVRYFSAALTYMNRRLTEAEALSGPAGRNEVAAALNSAISRDGVGAVGDFFKNGEKRDTCKRIIALMETGAFDIDSRSPMFDELQALVQFVERQ